MLPNWTYRAEPSWDMRDAGRLSLVASSAPGVLPRDVARPAWPNLASTFPNWTYPAESSWDMCGAGWLDLAAPSDLGDLPSDLARPAWPNLASTGSIWLAWASWPARSNCPGCSRAFWLARFGYQRKPQRLAFRLPASFVPARSVCIVSSCIVSSTIYINYWDLTLLDCFGMLWNFWKILRD